MSSSLLSQSVASIDILHHLRLMSILSISFGIINIDVWGVNDTHRSGDDRPAPSSLKGVSHVDRKSTRLELQSLMRISYAVFCLKKKHNTKNPQQKTPETERQRKNEN